MGININTQTPHPNESEKKSTEHLTLTDPSGIPEETVYGYSHTKTEHEPVTQNSNPDPAETDERHAEDAQECAHYFGYVSSGDTIPDECLTCPKLLKCLANKDGIQEEE